MTNARPAGRFVNVPAAPSFRPSESRTFEKETVAVPELPITFFARAVTTCVPMLRLLVVKVAPWPMTPSRSEVQVSDAPTS